MFLWLTIFVVLYFLYKMVIVPLFYWKKRGVPHHTPLPFLGNFAAVMFRKISFFHFQEQVYKDFKHERYSGYFQLTMPTLFINDLELIKQIGVKDFDHFTDHRTIANQNDILFFKNLFSLRGNEWRQMRAFLSPAFTSSKMRGMSHLMAECAQRVTNFYTEQNQKNIEVELKDLFSRFANDVIATCAFGLECDSLREPNNEFFTAGKDATNFRGFRGVKVLMANFSPEIFRAVGLRIIPKAITDFFINMIQDTIQYREEKNIVRPDVIHLLLEARRGVLKHEKKQEETEKDGFAAVEESDIGKQEVRMDPNSLTDLDIASQCFLFFFAGFDTASTLLSFLVSELAINPEAQEKLFAEIDEVMTRTKGTPNYDDIMKLKYLDMAVSETLRLWPPAAALDRRCTKDYTIEPVKDTEVPVTIRAGESVAIPIMGIHRDPQYFPNPRRFDPERFSEENKHKILPYSYLPFGVGPRNCIGSRFALLEAKIMAVYLLHKLEAVVCTRTSVPIVLTTKHLRIAPDQGFWVNLKSRTIK